MRRSIALLLISLLLVTLACGRQRAGVPPSPSAPTATVAPEATAGGLTPDQPAATEPLATAQATSPSVEATAPVPGPTAPPPTRAGVQTEVVPPAPAAYQPLYDSLQSIMQQFQATLTPQWDGEPAGTIIAGELAPATGNLGEQLLQLGNMDLVRQYLDALMVAGVTGVGVQISYPLLLPDYPRSAEYLAFYQEVAREVRQRGLTLLIESSPVFAGTQFSSVAVDYRGETVESYLADRQQMLVTIAREIGPDYLSIAHEPDTEIALTGLAISEAQFVRFVNDTIAAIGPDSGVLLGAGEGSWSNLALLRAFAEGTNVDFINVHVYPVVTPNQDPLANLVAAAEVARANGKRLVIGESWLYKADAADLVRAGVSLGAFYERDVFSFWQPLDEQFMETLALVGNIYDFDFISFFWSRYFFGYVDYDPAMANAASQQLFRQANRAAFIAIVQGRLSGPGQLISQLSGR